MTEPNPDRLAENAPSGPAWEPGAYAEVPRRKWAVIVASVVAAVLIAVAVITLGGGDSKPAAAPSATAPTAPPLAMPLARRANPEAVGDAFLADMQAHSLPGLRSLACSNAEVTLTQAEIDDIRSTLEVGSVVDTSTAQVTGHVFFRNDQLETITLSLRREGATSWCVYGSDKA